MKSVSGQWFVGLYLKNLSFCQVAFKKVPVKSAVDSFQVYAFNIIGGFYDTGLIGKYLGMHYAGNGFEVGMQCFLPADRLTFQRIAGFDGFNYSVAAKSNNLIANFMLKPVTTATAIIMTAILIATPAIARRIIDAEKLFSRFAANRLAMNKERFIPLYNVASDINRCSRFKIAQIQAYSAWYSLLVCYSTGKCPASGTACC